MRKALACAVLLATAGCTLPWEVRDPPEAFLDPDHPPALSIFPPFVDSEIAVEIPAFAYCWDLVEDGRQEACVDAPPPFAAVPVNLPAPGDVALTWMNLTGWAFTASAVEAEDPTQRSTELTVRIENDLLVTMPEGGVWDVTIRGQGPQGHAAYALRVTVGRAD
jgi:hypothetical protein